VYDRDKNKAVLLVKAASLNEFESRIKLRGSEEIVGVITDDEFAALDSQTFTVVTI